MGADAQSTIRLMVETAADTAALEQTAASFQKVEKATSSGGIAAAATNFAKVGEAAAKVATDAPKAAEAIDKVTAALAKEADAQNEHTQALNKSVPAAESAQRTLTKLADGKEKLRTSTGNAGQAMLVFGQTVQDAQYGMAAMSNNLPQLAMMLGMGGGLAGGVAIAAVGLDILINKFDIFGIKAAQAAEESKKLAEDLDYAAGKAREHAAQMDAEQAATLRYEESIRRINKAYDDQITKINEATEALKRKLAQEQAMEDAKTAQTIAEIDIEEASGRIAGSAAETKRREAQQQADRSRFERDQKAAHAEAAKAAEEGNAAAKKAAEMRKKAKDLDEGSRGLLDADERDRLTKKKEAIEAARAEAQRKADKEPAMIDVDRDSGLPVVANPRSMRVANPRKAEAQQKVRETENELAEINRAQILDEAARRRVGDKFSSEEAAKAEAAEQRRKAQDEDERARKAFNRRNQIREDMDNREKLFPEQQLAKDKQADARILKQKQQEEDKVKRDQERQQAKKDRESARQANKIAKSAEDLGLGSEGIQQLRLAAQELANADEDAPGKQDKDRSQLNAILSQLANTVRKMAGGKSRRDQPALAEIWDAIRTLESQVKEARSGN